jgi:Holliday junction resolvase RusA-like endonuclease
LRAATVGIKLDRSWLLDHGVDAETLDRAIAESVARSEPRPMLPVGTATKVATPPRLASLEAMAGRWVARILDWRPVSDNLRARGVKAWAAAKKRDREVIRELLVGRIPPATGRRKVSLVVTKKSRRGVTDPSNLLKSTLDSLVSCGLLVDDSQQWLEGVTVRIEVCREQERPVQSTITIEDLTS